VGAEGTGAGDPGGTVSTRERAVSVRDCRDGSMLHLVIPMIKAPVPVATADTAGSWHGAT
jgi:hypothetical protein